MALLLRNDSQPDLVFCDPADINTAGNVATLNGYFGTFSGTGFHLDCSGGVPGEFGYFLIGTGVEDPGIAISNGHLCLSTVGGNQFGRYNVSGTLMDSVGQFDAAANFQNFVGTAPSTGGIGFDVPSQIPTIGGTVTMGSTWYFQLWYRDGVGGASNFSNVWGQAF